MPWKIWRNYDTEVAEFQHFNEAMKWLISKSQEYQPERVHWFPANGFRLIFLQIEGTSNQWHVEGP